MAEPSKSVDLWQRICHEYLVEQLARVHFLRRTSQPLQRGADSLTGRADEWTETLLEEWRAHREDAIISQVVSHTQHHPAFRHHIPYPTSTASQDGSTSATATATATGREVAQGYESTVLKELDFGSLERMTFVDPHQTHMYQFCRQYSLELAATLAASPAAPPPTGGAAAGARTCTPASETQAPSQSTAHALYMQRRALNSRARQSSNGSNVVHGLMDCIQGSRTKHDRLLLRSHKLRRQHHAQPTAVRTLRESIREYHAMLLQMRARGFLARRKTSLIRRTRAAQTLQACLRVALASRRIRYLRVTWVARRHGARRILRWWRWCRYCQLLRSQLRARPLTASFLKRLRRRMYLVVRIQSLIRRWLAKREAAWQRHFSLLRAERHRQQQWRAHRRRLLLLAPVERSLAELELYVGREKEYVDTREAVERAAFDTWWAKFQSKMRRHYRKKRLPSNFVRQVRQTSGQSSSGTAAATNTAAAPAAAAAAGDGGDGGSDEKTVKASRTLEVFIDIHTGMEYSEHPHVLEARRILQQEYDKALKQLKERLRVLLEYRAELTAGYEARRQALLAERERIWTLVQDTDEVR